jgi:hypothetical protein
MIVAVASGLISSNPVYGQLKLSGNPTYQELASILDRDDDLVHDD